MAALTFLFLNAGRRVELLECFRRTLAAEKINARILASDINALAPAWHMADDRFLLPRSRDASFLNELIELSRNEKVDLILPLIDPDLQVLSDNRGTIEATGASVLVSQPGAIRICRDKELTSKFLVQRGIPCIPVLSLEEACNAAFPLVVKPKSGSSSIGVFKAVNRAELEFFVNYVPDAIVQPHVTGNEFTVDVFCHPHDGRSLLAVPRRRIKVRGGEVSVGIIDCEGELDRLAAKVVEAIGIAGPANVQFILASDGPRVLEVNPRFGGGCPLSIAGGAPFVSWCIDIARRRPLRDAKEPIARGLTMMRYDSSLFVTGDAS